MVYQHQLAHGGDGRDDSDHVEFVTNEDAGSEDKPELMTTKRNTE